MTLFFWYFFRFFLKWYMVVIGVIVLIIALFDLGELVRRSVHKPLVTLPILIEMVVLKLPFLIQKLLPFITLFSTMITFWKLHKSQELLAFQNAGISIWQILYPLTFLLIVINAFILFFFHPIGASMMHRVEQLETFHLKGHSNRVTIAKTGFWIRQSDTDGYTIIRAQQVDLDNSNLRDVTFIHLNTDNEFKSRFEAKQAFLKPGYWNLQQVQCIKQAETTKAWVDIPTSLTKEKIIDSTVPPNHLSLWQIPRFVSNFKNLGLSTTKYWIYWHEVLARPLACLAMVIIAASTVMRVNRRTSAFKRLSLGTGIGFLIYIFSDVSLVLGYSATIPTILSIWGPIGIVLLLATAVLIHLQDG